MKIFSIYDSKAEAYLQPFFADTEGVAERMAQQAANDESHMFHQHAGDYTMFQVGEWDQEKGELVGCTPRVCCGMASLIRYEPAAKLDQIIQRSNGEDLTQENN